VLGGALRALRYELPVASAQVKSAILLAGLAADGPTTVVEPVATRTHTEEMLARSGARIEVAARPDGRHTTVWPSSLEPRKWSVPADPSQAVFFLVAALLASNGEVVVRDVELGEERTGFLGVLEQMNATLVVQRHPGGRGDLVATSSSLGGARHVAASQLPSLDEVPILAVAAAAADGVTTFHDVGELRVKESDRLDATCRLLGALGAPAVADADGLVITGLGSAGAFRRIEFDAKGDHRMAMAAAIAATVGAGGTVRGFAGVATSDPGFLAALASLR
jgi:3-phosphoshikimate 1-carboxyvinyltransferase